MMAIPWLSSVVHSSPEQGSQTALIPLLACAARPSSEQTSQVLDAEQDPKEQSVEKLA